MSRKKPAELVFNFLSLLIAHSVCLQKHEIITCFCIRNTSSSFSFQSQKWFSRPVIMKGNERKWFWEEKEAWLLFWWLNTLLCGRSTCEIWGLLSFVIPLCPYILPLFFVFFNIHIFSSSSFYIVCKNQKLS